MGVQAPGAALQSPPTLAPVHLHVQADGTYQSAGTGGLRVAAGLYSAASLGSDVNIPLGNSNAAVTLLATLASRLTGECSQNGQHIVFAVPPHALHAYRHCLCPICPSASAAGETLQLRMSYQQDASLLLNADFTSSAAAPSGRRLLAVPSIAGTNATTVVSGE